MRRYPPFVFVAVAREKRRGDVLDRQPGAGTFGDQFADDAQDLRLGGLRALLDGILVQLPQKSDDTVSRRRIVDHRNERPENLLQPRLEIASARAVVPPRVLEVSQTIEEQLVPQVSGLLVERVVEIQRNLASERAAAHVFGDAAALQGAVLEEAAGSHDLRAE